MPCTDKKTKKVSKSTIILQFLLVGVALFLSIRSWASSEQLDSVSEGKSDPPVVSTTSDPAPSSKSPEPNLQKIRKNTRVNLSYYFDNRNYNTMNILLNSTGLPWGFNIFGFTDLHGTEGQSSNRFDLTRFYHEYRLRRPIEPDWLWGIKGFDVELEYNDGNGPNNSIARAAIGYQHSVPFLDKGKSWLQWRILPWRSDGKGWQLSNTHFFVLTDRIKLIGFADYNIMNRSPNQWVVESELSYTLTDTFDLIVEGRFNGFEEANPSLDGVGAAGGIRIKL